MARGVSATVDIPSTPLNRAKTPGIIYERVTLAACPLKGCLGYLFINLPIFVGKKYHLDAVHILKTHKLKSKAN